MAVIDSKAFDQAKPFLVEANEQNLDRLNNLLAGRDEPTHN